MKVLERLNDAAGIFAARARAIGWRLLGARLDGKVNIGSGVRMVRPSQITIGRRTVLEDDVYLKLVTDEAKLVIAEHVFIGRAVEIDCSVHVSIGAHSQVAPMSFITDHTHNIAAARRIDTQGITSAAVTIGQDVWIGSGAVILAGVTVGDEAVIGANAVVRHDVAARQIVAGVPAQVIGQRK